MIVQLPMLDDRKSGYGFLSPVSSHGKWRAWHCGNDLNFGKTAWADFDAEVKPMADGKVVYSRNAGPGWGNLVVIYHHELTKLFGDPIYSRYAHFNKVLVSAEQEVTKSSVIGFCGKTGTSSPHVHWEVLKRKLDHWTLYPNGWSEEKVLKYWFNPYKFMEEANQKANEVSEFAEESVEKAIGKMIATQWTNPKQIVGDAVVEQVFINLGVLKQREGNLTKERLIVALDRLHVFDKL